MKTSDCVKFEILAEMCPRIPFFRDKTLRDWVIGSWLSWTMPCRFQGMRLPSDAASYPRRTKSSFFEPFRCVTVREVPSYDIASRMGVHVHFVQNCRSKSNAPTYVWRENIRPWSRYKCCMNGCFVQLLCLNMRPRFPQSDVTCVWMLVWFYIRLSDKWTEGRISDPGRMRLNGNCLDCWSTLQWFKRCLNPLSDPEHRQAKYNRHKVISHIVRQDHLTVTYSRTAGEIGQCIQTWQNQTAICV
jgi:hypothetical protein